MTDDNVWQINCLTHIFFDEALERAKELDSIYANTKQVVGPYHGLPFCVKVRSCQSGTIEEHMGLL